MGKTKQSDITNKAIFRKQKLCNENIFAHPTILEKTVKNGRFSRKKMNVTSGNPNFGLCDFHKLDQTVRQIVIKDRFNIFIH